jgi:ribosome-binding factor A
VKAPGRRPQRVAEAIREVVAPFLQNQIRDRRVGLVTVTAVHVTPDLQRAVVSVVIHGDEAEHARTLQGLASAAGTVRHEVGRVLSLRTVPEIAFELDKGTEHASHIAAVLATLRRLEDEGKGAAQGHGEGEGS